jgi:K+-transporting ATPase ATPase C chain
MLREQIKPAVTIFLVLTVITGVIYPLVVTGIAQVFFHRQANGSLISQNGKIVGSSLIGQNFDDPKYLWGRPSATGPVYNAAASSGSNLGPLNPMLTDNIQARIAALKSAEPDNNALIPVDLVTASASGLDPHISLAGAYYQLPRLAQARQLPEENIKAVIDQNIQGRFWGLLGEPVVNVLEVNLALDENRIE